MAGAIGSGAFSPPGPHLRPPTAVMMPAADQRRKNPSGRAAKGPDMRPRTPFDREGSADMRACAAGRSYTPLDRDGRMPAHAQSDGTGYSSARQDGKPCKMPIVPLLPLARVNPSEEGDSAPPAAGELTSGQGACRTMPSDKGGLAEPVSRYELGASEQTGSIISSTETLSLPYVFEALAGDNDDGKAAFVLPLNCCCSSTELEPPKPKAPFGPKLQLAPPHTGCVPNSAITGPFRDVSQKCGSFFKQTFEEISGSHVHVPR